MKRIVFIVLVVTIGIFVLSCKQKARSASDPIPADVVNNPGSASDQGDIGNLPQFKFDEESHDFGQVIQGEKVTYAFEFVNSGKTELVIASASASCGCTVAEYPKIPVRPGEKGVVSVSFNTEGRKGFQNKTITLAANTQPNTKVLSVKAFVVVPEEK